MLLLLAAKSRFVRDLHRSLRCQPVGTHPDHRNGGPGIAVVLREACGFTPWHLIDDYVELMPGV